MKKLFLSALVILFTVHTPGVYADVKGSKDHPEIGRFKGSKILGYKYQEFNEYLFPEGEVYRDKDDKYKYRESSLIEGKLTRIYYIAPKETSVAQVFRSYEKQLKKKGFKEVFKCKGKGYACGYNMQYMENLQPELVKYAYQMGQDNRYISMKRSDPKGDIYVSLLVFEYNFDYYGDRYRHPAIQLDVIEAEPLADDQIEVISADKIISQVNAEGRVALQGIYFDTNKTVLKPESGPAIEQIHKAMTSSPELKLHVVGHTDNVGSFDYNMKLSRGRANAVKAELTARGIKPERLRANGVASLAPVASNNTEEGRAKNRRVELVAQ